MDSPLLSIAIDLMVQELENWALKKLNFPFFLDT